MQTLWIHLVKIKQFLYSYKSNHAKVWLPFSCASSNITVRINPSFFGHIYVLYKAKRAVELFVSFYPVTEQV